MRDGDGSDGRRLATAPGASRRRQVLRTVGALGVAATAGCTTDGGGPGEDGEETATTTATATTTQAVRDPAAVLNDWSRWTAGSGRVTETSEASSDGNGSALKLTDDDGSAVRAANTGFGTVDLSNTSLSAAIKWVKPKGGVAFRLLLRDEAGNRLSTQTNAPSNGDDGWVDCEFGLVEELDGEPVDLTAITGLTFVFYNGAEAETEVYIDEITPVEYEAPRGAVLFTADDGNASQFTEMHPVLREYGYTATYFVQSDRVGQEQYMSEPEMHTLADRGAHVSCHPQRSAPLPEMSDEQQYAAIRTEYDYVSSRFGTDHAKNMSWPYSRRDAGAVADAAEFHDLVFVGTDGATAGYRSAAPYSIIRCSFNSLSDLTRALDIAERYNRVLIPQFHVFDSDQPTGGVSIKPEHFESFVEDVDSTEVDVLTPKDLLDRRERT